MRYFKELGLEGEEPELIGMESAIARVKEKFPSVLAGYFNPRPVGRV